jgi:hypothetical protein
VILKSIDSTHPIKKDRHTHCHVIKLKKVKCIKAMHKRWIGVKAFQHYLFTPVALPA